MVVTVHAQQVRWVLLLHERERLNVGRFIKCFTDYHLHFIYFFVNPTKNLKSFPSHKGPQGGADLRFNSPQPDTSWNCKSTDTGLVCRVECLFKFPACTGTNLLLGKQN